MFPELTIVGTPYERGRQYGVATAALVRHSIASYARLFAHRRGLDWAASQAEASRYLPLLAEVAPDLLEEMRGIAAGSGHQLAEIVALNVRTELMAGIGIGVAHPAGPAALARNRAAGVPEHGDEGRTTDDETTSTAFPTFVAGSDDRRPTTDDGRRFAPGRSPFVLRPDDDEAANTAIRPDDGECTTAAAAGAASAGGATLLAQTWDWQGDQRAACVLLRVQAPGEPAILTLTEAGMVAKIGLNSAGLAVSLNLLRSRDDGRELGMPVHVLLRKMLQAHSFAEALGVASLAPAAGSSCVNLAGAAGELVSLEISPAGVAEIWAEGGLLAHTNHCLDAAAAAGECTLEPTSTSRERRDRAHTLLAAQRGAVDIAALQAILRDHAGAPRCICRHPDPRLPRIDCGESICGVVIDLDARVMHVAADVPCQAEFVAVGLS